MPAARAQEVTSLGREKALFDGPDRVLRRRDTVRTLGRCLLDFSCVSIHHVECLEREAVAEIDARRFEQERVCDFVLLRRGTFA